MKKGGDNKDRNKEINGARERVGVRIRMLFIEFTHGFSEPRGEFLQRGQYRSAFNHLKCRLRVDRTRWRP